MKKMYSILTLLVAAGILLSACSAGGSASLKGSSWELTSWEASGVKTPAVPGIETSLVFGDDGQVSGRMGCNSFGGDYKLGTGKITFGNLMSTLMACADPQMNQESHAFTVMQGTVTYTITGDVLTITNGSLSITLARK